MKNYLQSELAEKLSKMYNVNDPKTIVLFGFKTQFGGGKSTGFGMIYDNIDSLKKYDAFYRQVRVRLLRKRRLNF